MELSRPWRLGRWPRDAALGGLLLLAAAIAPPTAAQTPATPVVPPTDHTAEGITQTETVVVDGGGAGGANIVLLRNTQDARLRIRGNIGLNRISGPRVEPRNLASAYASCTDCQTLVVALQLNLYERTATSVAPENAALAVNEGCTRCYTVARAIQYTLPVDDPMATPSDVAELIRHMDRELREIATDKTMDLAKAEARIDAVIARFTAQADGLNQQRMEATGSTSRTPTPTAAGSPIAAGGATATLSSAPVTMGTGMPTASPTPLP